MKKMNKIVSAILCMVMLMGILPVGLVSADAVLSWIDVDDSYYYIYYDETSQLWEAKGDGKLDIYNSDGEKILNTNYIAITSVDERILIAHSENNKSKIIDVDGNEILPLEYEYIEHLTADFFKVGPHMYDCGIIDINGKEIVPCGYFMIDLISNNNVLLCKNLGHDSEANSNIFQYELCNLKDNSRVNLPYKQCSIYDGNLVVRDQSDLYGIIDVNGKEIIPCVYERILWASNNFFVIRDENCIEILNIKGNSIIKKECDECRVIEDNFVYTVKYTDYPKYEYEIYNLNGKQLSTGYADLSIMNWDNVAKDEYLMVHEDSGSGLADVNGNIIIPAEYEWLASTKNSEHFIACKNGKVGIIDITNKELVPCVYDNIEYWSPYMLEVSNGKIWDEDSNYVRGVITIDGYEIIPLGDRDFQIDEDGKGTYVICTEGSGYGRRFAKLKTMNVEDADKFVLGIGFKTASVWGELVDNDVAPMLKESRTMLPARFVAENLGAEVSWNGEEQKVIIKGKDKEIVLKINSNIATVNGEEKQIDSPAFIENGRTYTPVRFVAEELGAKVGWDDANKQVIITK